MLANATTAAPSLTEYEADQVARIAAWKCEHPLIISEVFRMIAQPIAHAAERIIPDSLARGAVNLTYHAAEATAWRQDIMRQARVDDLAELHHRPLEDCDRLAQQVGRSAELIAAAEGALTGAGGPWTTVLDIPLLFAVAIRTVLRIGHCYGYPLDRKTDRAYVLGVMVAALANTRERKQHLLARLREIEDLLLEEMQENLVTEEAASLLFQLEVFEEIPGVGAISGAVLNFSTLWRVERAARCVFQERWLHDQKKIRRIEPAPDVGMVPAAGDWAGVLGRALYSGSYYASFGATFPLYAMAAVLPGGKALTRNVQRGAASTSAGVSRLVVRVRGVLGRSRRAPKPATAPS